MNDAMIYKFVRNDIKDFLTFISSQEGVKVEEVKLSAEWEATHKQYIITETFPDIDLDPIITTLTYRHHVVATSGALEEVNSETNKSLYRHGFPDIEVSEKLLDWDAIEAEEVLDLVFDENSLLNGV